MSKFNGVYIPSIDAKDIFISNNYVNGSSKGYSLFDKNGDLNKRRFINTLDFSLELIKLREVYREVHKRKRGFSTFIDGKEYCNKIINVTFNYCNKDWNQYSKSIFVKFGYNIRELDFIDNIAWFKDEVVGIITDSKVENYIDLDKIPNCFCYSEDEECYKSNKRFKVLNDVSDLRKNIYENGFFCDGIKYIRFKRSSGSSRVGKCLFIEESLYDKMHDWELCGLKVNEGDDIDLAAFESYISLTLSSIIDTVHITKENILVIDDYENSFYSDVSVTKVEDNSLSTSIENMEIVNNIWDGQSLLDSSIFKNNGYSQYGMLLLRNRFFKSACFNSNIQQWFSDNGIENIEQLNGFTLAKDIKDIKLITTPSSIKYKKFGSIQQWLDNLIPVFGLVKHEKPQHYFNGRMVQMHYQLLNSLQLKYDDVKKLVQPDLDYMNLMKSDPSVLRYHLKYPSSVESFDKEKFGNKNDMVFQLLGLNNKFYNTKICRDFIQTLLNSYYKNLKCGHILIDGTYSTLFGNPIEMLEHSIGKFNGENKIEIGTCVTSFFADEEKIICSRSPHISFSNVLILKNKYYDNIFKYFNLSREIICVNSINENILNQLSGADYDSDTVLISNNKILIKAGEKNYGKFNIPVNMVDAKSISRTYTQEEKFDLDLKTSVNLIGEIINFSQELNSLYWHRIFNGFSHKDNQELYLDICQLDIMSRIEIDSAKKEFPIVNKRELKKLKIKYEEIQDQIGGKPDFFKVLAKIKQYDVRDKKFIKYETPMDYLQTCIKKHNIYKFRKKDLLDFSEILDIDKFDYRASDQNSQVKNIISGIYSYVKYCNFIWDKPDLEKSEKFNLCKTKYSELFTYVEKMKINYHTAFRLILICDDKKYSDISKILLALLFETKFPIVSEIFMDSIEKMKEIYEEIGGNIHIFNIYFSKK